MTDQPDAPGQAEEKRPESVGRPPLVFVSHDSRDAKIAAAFSRLLTHVSAGVLKSFRSSDKSGKQGIDYGVEWFPEIMRNMQQATDVVCLLTANSLDRPWILFEAGVAKGKLDTPILGLAIGIPLSAASSGPFAQFQNSDDEAESLIKLVRQLLAKIPHADPDDEVIRPHVTAFMNEVSALLDGPSSAPPQPETTIPVSGETDARLFEEVKVMFGDLSAKLERSERGAGGRDGRLPHPEVVYRLTREARGAEQGFKMALTVLKSELPWFYDMGIEALLTVKRARTKASAHEHAERFIHSTMAAADAWAYTAGDSREHDFLREYTMILGDALRFVADDRTER